MTNIEFIRKQWMNINAMIHEEGMTVVDNNGSFISDVGVDEYGFYYCIEGDTSRRYMAIHAVITDAATTRSTMSKWRVTRHVANYKPID